ncbi:MAG: TonB-dependent receptor [Rhodocyclaceae bacterium]
MARKAPDVRQVPVPDKGIAQQRRPWCAAYPAALLFAASTGLQAAEPEQDLADLSLEQLSKMRVTSASRRAEPLATAPASIYVITAADIRRANARSLPEALQLAPNLQVARLNAREYAISARGFNSTAANKLQVQLDGRSLYTPLFSGTLWDVQDTFMADIDRIEIISGPGASLWGSNAVNGVINIITRRAEESRGTLISGSTGSSRHGVAARHGGELGETTDFRIYAKRDNHEVTERIRNISASDAWNKTQGGFRLDSGTAMSGFTIQGDAYDGELDPVLPERQHISGANLLLRWSDTLGKDARYVTRYYYDSTRRHSPGIFNERLQIHDFLTQLTLKVSDRQDFILGGNYRVARDHIINTTSAFMLVPESETLQRAGIFAQDDLMLTKTTRASVGMLAEYNSYTHWEFMPTLRLSQQVGKDSVIWSSLSRSVRAPSRIDRDLYATGSTSLAGGPEFESEIANTAELGLRSQVTSALSFSLTTFYERFRRLRAGRIVGSAVQFNNGLEGHSYGVEGWSSYRLNRAWRFDAGFTRLRMNYAAQPGSIGDQSSLGNDPKYQWQLRSYWDPIDKLSLSAFLRHVSELPNPRVPSYTALDLHGGYKLTKNVTTTLSILNAQGGEHREFGTTATGSEFGASFHLGLSVGF